MNKAGKTVIIVICVVLAMVIAIAAYDGFFLETKYDISRDEYDVEREYMSDIQFALIRAGISAASSHNMQPWKVRIEDGTSFTLLADMNKTLPVIDPDNKQLMMSQGTFISAVKVYALENGIDLRVEYQKPDYNSEFPEIASFFIMNDAGPDIDGVTSATAGNEDSAPVLGQNALNEIVNRELPEARTVFISGEELQTFQEYLRSGTANEARNIEANAELLDVFHFTKWEKNKFRYGLSLNTIAPVVRTFIEPLVGLTSTPQNFGKSSISAFERRLAVEEAYLVISLDSPEPTDYIKVGEALTMLGLETTGYIVKPAVQLIQPIDGMREIYEEMTERFNIDGEVVQIIGFTKASSGYHESIRHRVMDIVIVEQE